MGRLARGALWLTFLPAGAVASVRAGQRKDTKRILDAIEAQRRPPAVRPHRWRGWPRELAAITGMLALLAAAFGLLVFLALAVLHY